jgi:lactate permease
VSIVLACIPFLLVLLCFLGGWKSWQTGLLTLGITILLACGYFHLSLQSMLTALQGALFPALAAALILFPARLLYVLEEEAGTIKALAQMIQGKARPLVVLLLVLGVSPLLEATCGFGTGMVVSIPLYTALGIAPEQAAFLGLLGESTTAYASMGNAVSLEASMTALPLSSLGMDTALLLLPCSLVCACMALLLVGGRRTLADWWPVAASAGMLLVGGEWATSHLDVTVAGVVSSLLAGFVPAVALWWQHSKERDATRLLVPLQSHRTSPPRQALNRLLVVPGTLVLVGPLLMHLVPLRFASLLVIGKGTYRFVVLWYPGTWLVLACISVVVLLLQQGVAISLGAMLWKASKRFFPLATTIVAFVLTSALLSTSGMLDALITLFAPLGAMYLAVAPMLGMLGGWISGSNASSNALLAPMQVSMAPQGAVLWVAAAQNAASSLGRMLAPAYLLVAASAASTREQEITAPLCWLIGVAFLGMETILAFVFAPLWVMLGTESFTLLVLYGLSRYLVSWYPIRQPITVLEIPPGN